MLNENDIRGRVYILVDSYSKGIKFKEEDKVVINAGIDLIVNLLWCVNVIANKRSD